MSLLGAWSCSGCGGSAPRAPVASSRTVRLDVAYLSELRAAVLVDGAGYTLYIFLPDDRRGVTCTGTCALTWPPFTVPARTRPALGSGVEAGLVATDRAPDGAHVVTYDGWPLYTYTGDVAPGTASGQAISLDGGTWYAMRPDGAPLASAGLSGAFGGTRRP